MGSSDFLLDGIDVENAEVQERIRFLQQKGAIARSFSEQDAVNLANFVRSNPSTSPDLAGAVATTRMPYDSPALSAIVKRDENTQTQFQQILNGTLGKVTRPVIAGFYSIYDEAVSRPLRTATLMAQGHDPAEAYMRSGSSTFGQMAREAGEQGIRPTLQHAFAGSGLGTGIIPGQAGGPLMQPGAGAQLEGFLEEGYSPTEAQDLTAQWVQNRYGTNYMQKAFERSETTMLHKTIGDETFSYHLTPGRLFMQPFTEVIRPETGAWNFATGMADLSSQLALDPNNALFDFVNAAVRGRRLAVPTPAGELNYEALGGRRIQEIQARGRYAESGMMTEGAEGLYFHGGEEFIDEKVLKEGGISSSIARARKYAEYSDPDLQRIHVLEEAHLPPEVRKHLEEVGDVEQYVEEIFEPLTPEQQALWDEMSETMSFYDEDYHTLLRERQELMDEVLNDPDYRAFQEAELKAGREDGIFTRYAMHMKESEYWDDLEFLNDQIDQAWERFNNAMADGKYEFGNRWRYQIDDEILNRTSAYQPPVAATYTMEELNRMQEWGFIFPDRRQYEIARQLNEAAQQAGAVRSKRKWFAPTTHANWQSSRRGQLALDWMTRVSSPSRIMDRIPGIDWYQAKQIADSKSPERIAEILAENWGIPGRLTRTPLAPIGHRVLGSTMPLDVSRGLRSAMTRWHPGGSETGLRRWFSRVTAETGGTALNPYDFHETYDTVTNYLRTIGVERKTIDNILDKAWRARGNHTKTREVLGDLVDAYSKRLRDRGYSAEDVERIFDTYFSEQRTAQLYGVDRVANPIHGGRFVEMRSPDGHDFRIYLDEPELDSEFADLKILVPAVRDLRRSTAAIRRLTDRMRQHPVGLETSRIQKVVDGLVGGWRDLQLMRPGWTMSVFPDEFARTLADDYGEMANPFNIVALTLANRGRKLPNGEFLDEILDLQDYGIAAFGHNLQDKSLDVAQVRASSRRASWVPVRTVDEAGRLTPGGRRGLAQNVMQIYKSQLAQAVARHNTVDDAIAYFRTTEDGRRVLNDIMRRAHDGTTLSKLGDDDVLRFALERADARRHQYAGGSWLRRHPDEPGIWLDDTGQRVQDFDRWNPETQKAWTIDELRAELDKAEIPYVTRDRRPELVRKLREANGVPTDIDRIANNQTFVITRKGNSQILEMMHTGRVGGPTDLNMASAQWLQRNAAGLGDVGSSNQVYYAVHSGGVYHNAQRAVAEAGDTGRISLIKKEGLDEIFENDILEGAVTDFRPEFHRNEIQWTVDVPYLRGKGQELIDAGEVRYVFDEMDIDDIERLGDRVFENYTPDAPPPPRVKAPQKNPQSESAAAQFVNKVFFELGARPSIRGVRQPYTTLKIWDNLAEYYLYAVDDTRSALRQAAEETGMGLYFDRYVQRHLRNRRMKDLPPPTATQFSLDELTEIAVSQAAGDTRDLLYDLSKSGNWSDSARVAFSFADAWWELLTRWAGLFNPAEKGGTVLRNVRRLGQGRTAALRSDWVDVNEYGQETLNFWPSATGLLPTPEGLGLGAGMDPTRLFFFNPTNLRSMGAPGSSPFLQTAMAAVRPQIPSEIREPLDTLIYGEFGPPNLQDWADILNTFSPTYLRNIGRAMLGGEQDENLAGLRVRISNILAATPQYADHAVNPQTQARLQYESNQIASSIAWMQALESFFTPAQPSRTLDLIRADPYGTQVITNISAVASDRALLRQYFDPETADAYIMDMYDLVGMNIASTTKMVLPRPVNRTQFDYMRDNTDLERNLPYTLIHFLPPTDDDEFYQEAYNYQKQQDEFGRTARVNMSVADASAYRTRMNGQNRLEKLNEQRDRALLLAESLAGGKDTDEYRSYRDDVIAPWYNDEKYNIDLQYFTYQPGKPQSQLAGNPSYEEVFSEVRRIGTTGTVENGTARQHNETLATWLEGAVANWETAERVALSKIEALGLDHQDADWWRTSTAGVDDPEVFSEAELIREWFRSELERTATMARLTDPDSFEHMKWFAESLFTPLLEGWDFDDPMLIAPAPAPQFADADEQVRRSLEGAGVG